MSENPPPYPQQQPPPPPPPAYGHQSQPTAYPAQTPAADIRPKARWFWIGGGIMLLGIVAAIVIGVLGFFGISDEVDGFERVAAGSGTANIDDTGSYVIYAEDGGFFAAVEVLSPDGEPVRTESYDTSLDYDFGGRSGRAVGTFEADETGSYTFITDTDIAIGRSITGDLIRTILIPFVVAGLGFLIGLIVIIVTAVKRSRSKKRAATVG